MRKELVRSIFTLVLLVSALLPRVTRAEQVGLLRTPDSGIQPQAAVDSKGTVHLIYFKGDPKGGDIFYVRREPGEKEFSKPMAVNTQPHTAMALGTIRGAQLAVGKNGRVHVAWDGMGGGSSLDSHPGHGDDHSGHAGHSDNHSAHSRPAHDAS